MTRCNFTLVLALFVFGCGDDAGGGNDGSGGEGTGSGGGGSSATGGTGTGGGGSGGMTATGTGGEGTGGEGAGGDGTGGGGTGGEGTGGDGTGGGGSGGMAAGGSGGGTPPVMGTVCKAPVPASDPGNTCPTQDPVPLKATLLAGSLDTPIFVTHAPGDAERLFVVQRNGVILLYEIDGTAIGTFLDIDDRVIDASGTSERGLLGMAFHPDYPTDPRFFVAYTAPPTMGGNSQFTVSSFEVSSSDPNDADETSEAPVIDFPHPQSNHNGGMLAFGPDGCLFIGSGDGGGSGDPQGNGQQTNTPLGKMLRVDVDNPTVAAPGNLAGASYPHIWDYGLRNPWRFSFDRMTGDLYIGDVGQGVWEEVDVEPAGSGNHNYGWNEAEGNHCYGGSCTLGDFVGAIDEYEHVGGDNCVIGGYVYRGTQIPSLQGWYLHADNGSNRIRAFVWDGSQACQTPSLVISERDSISVDGDITSFGEDAAGEIYVATMTSVYRIDPQ